MKQYHRMYRRHFTAALVCMLAAAAFAVGVQFLKGQVLDLAVAGSAGAAFRHGLLLAGFILCEVGCYYGDNRFRAAYVAGCTGALKRDIFRRILGTDYVAHRAQPQGAHIARCTAEADAIRERRFRMMPMFWEICFRIILVSAALFRLDGGIAVITIALLTTPLYIPKLIEKKLQNAQAASLRASEAYLSAITDWLAGFEIIKNFAVEDRILARFRLVNEAEMDSRLREDRLGAVSQLVTTLMSYLSYFIVLVCAARLVLLGRFTPGDFFVAVGMIDQLSWPLISLAEIVRQLAAIRPACEAMEAYLREPEGERPSGGTGEFSSEIRFADVSFSYDGQRQILSHFDLTLRKGRRYLLKGPSGCGKTTAVNLLLGYYRAAEGRITLDGRPLADPYSLITVVRQEAVLFRDTLRRNLDLYQELPEAALLEALRQVGLERLADPGALDSPVEENGANFSGGEKKRICLARALLRNTPVLILDEPLANLDPAAAERIEDTLLGIREKTILVVSHQFSESKLAAFDRVVTF